MCIRCKGLPEEEQRIAGAKDDADTVKAVDIVAFEQHFDMSMSRLEKEIRMTHLFFMAHQAQKRTGETKDDFDKWLDGVYNVVMGEQKK